MRTVSSCKFVLIANYQNPGNFHRLFCLEICLSRKSSKHRTSSKTVLPGKMSLPRIINITETVKDFFARKNLTAANHLYLGVIQGNFHLQSFGSRKSSISPKYSKLSSHAKLSRTQIINTREIVKEFFARKYLSARNHLYLGVSQESFHLQNCLNRKSSISRENSQTSSPENLSKPQIIKTPDEFKDCFAWKNVFASNHQYPGNGQRIFRQELSLGHKSSISRSYSRKFSPAKLS